ADSKDRPPMLAPGWIDKKVPISEGSPITRTEKFQETYKNVSQDIRDQLNAKAEAVQIILTGMHQNEVNEIRAERIVRVANPLALVAQQQPVYHPQNHPTHYTQNSSTRSQQAVTRNRGKALVNSPQPIYDQKPSMVDEDDEMSKDKEIDKLMALISLSFKKIYKPTNNNLRTSSNTSRANQDNSPRINRNTGYENQRNGNVTGARETVGSTVVQKSRIQCYNCKEFRHVARECHKPKRVKDAAYHREKMLLCKQEEAGIQLNAEQADWRDDTDDDELEDQGLEAHYIEHPEQSKSVHVTYPIEQDTHNVIIDSLDMSYDRGEIDQNDDDNDLANERELLASLIEKLKCETDESKNRNKFLETSNRVLVEKLKEMKDKLSTHQETIYILSQQKESQIKLYKTREDKELDKVIALENKVKVLDNIVYKTDQSVQTINMLNNKCRTSFAKPEFLKKAQRANPRLNAGYEHQRLGNVAGARETIGSSMKPKRAKDAAYHREKMLLCKQEEAGIQLNAEQADWKDDTDDESDDQELEAHYMYMAKIQKVSPDAVDSRPIFDTKPEQKIDQNDDLAKERELLASLIGKLKCEIDETKNRNTLLETSNKVLVEKLKSELEDFRNKNKSLTEANNKLSKENDLLYADFKKSKAELKRRDSIEYASEMELECAKVRDSLTSQPETQKTQFVNEIDRLSREYYYADHMNAILGVYTELDEVTNLQCDYLELFQKCECLETELSKSKMMSKSFESVQKHAINLELELQQFQISSDPAPECQTVALEHDSLSPGRKCQENVSHRDKTVTTSNELDLLFSPMFDELLNGSSKVVSKSFVVSAADAPNERQQLTTPLNNHSTPAATYADLSGTPVNQTKYRSIVRALMYLTAIRPDIMHATCYCARYQVNLTEKHFTAVKRIFRYLKDTIHMGLWYPKDTGFNLTTFFDSDHAGCLDSRKSTSGGIRFLGGAKLVSWSSTKHDCTLMSSAEAEYVSLSTCCAQVEKGIVEQFFVGTEYQLADLFTKALPVERFKYLVRRLGMRCLTPEELEALANESS
nr:hypothetical protein [Tanacetum cinerariifolium]